MILAAAVLAAWLPTASLTPGAMNLLVTPENIQQNICKKGWSTKSIRPPASYTSALKRKQLKQARYVSKNVKLYEEDHLISLEIGGDPKSEKNLWPEPYAGTCGARTKDRLEDKLHELVCSGRVALRDAQQAIAWNWIETYNRYIGPLECK